MMKNAASFITGLKPEWDKAVSSGAKPIRASKGKYSIGWDEDYDSDGKGAIVLNYKSYNTATNALAKSNSKYTRQLFNKPSSTISSDDLVTLKEYLCFYRNGFATSTDKATYLLSLLKNKTFLTDVILRINWENSTHLDWAYEMTDHIYNVCNNRIKNSSKRIVDVLADPHRSDRDERDAVVTEIAIKRGEKGSKKAWSFATKFCYYITEWLVLGHFDESEFTKKRAPFGTPFAIFDSVVAEILPYYQRKHGLPNSKFNPSRKKFSYAKWEEALEEVWKKEQPSYPNEPFVPHVMDRILWWGYRNGDKYKNKDLLTKVLSM